MAVNQTAIALDACTRIVNATNKLLDALDELESIAEHLAGAGITLSTFDEAIAGGSGIAQATGQQYQFVATDCVGEIVTRLKAFYSGTPTAQGWTAMQKVRT